MRVLAAVLDFLRTRDRGTLAKVGTQRSESAGEKELDGDGAIPLVHRLAIVYLVLPVAVWLVGWFEWWFGLPAVVVLGMALWKALSGSWRLSLQPAHAIIALLALGWVMATAAGGIFDINNVDWDKHRALFVDLARGPWPGYRPTWSELLLAFRPEDAEMPFALLRYYLGYYIVPGLFGKWFGLAALNWAVPIWTWCGVALMLAMFARGLRTWQTALAALIFIFFSGMDVAMHAMFAGWDWLAYSFSWNGWPLVSLGPSILGVASYWEMDITYRSHMLGLMWSPQHFIAGGICTLLLVQLWRQRRFLAVSAIVVGSSVFWSPFVAAGTLPFALILVIKNGVRPFLRWQSFVVALPIVLLLLTYLTSGTGNIRRNWLWESTALDYVARSLPVIYFMEFLLLAALLLLLRPKLLREPFFIACLLSLLLLPLYSYGRFNDYGLRVVIPPLICLSYACIRAVFNRLPDAIQNGWELRRVILTSAIAAVLGIGAFGGIVNLTGANNNHDLQVLRYSQFGWHFSIASAVDPPLVTQYIARDVPRWFRVVLRERTTTSEPIESELIVRSHFDVFLVDGEIVVYVREACTQEDSEAKFILHVYPQEAKGRAHETLDFTFSGGWGMRQGETCVAARVVPNYAIGRIVAGQFTPTRIGQSWLGNYYSREYRDLLVAEAGAPIIQSDFTVHMNDNRLVYTRDRCAESDVAIPFGLRVFPIDARDLHESERQEGFEYFEFDFTEHGDFVGEGCVMVVELPDYAVLKIETGQYLPGGSILWDGWATLNE